MTIAIVLLLLLFVVMVLVFAAGTGTHTVLSVILFAFSMGIVVAVGNTMFVALTVADNEGPAQPTIGCGKSSPTDSHSLKNKSSSDGRNPSLWPSPISANALLNKGVTRPRLLTTRGNPPELVLRRNTTPLPPIIGCCEMSFVPGECMVWEVVMRGTAVGEAVAPVGFICV